MDNKSDVRSPMCRLCLRVYSNDKLKEIFNNESAYEGIILATVLVQPLREDSTTRICVHCRHILSLINAFKMACLQSDILLKNSSYKVESDTWSILNGNDILQQAADLVERHQQEIHAIFKKVDIYEDVSYDRKSDTPRLENAHQSEVSIEEVLANEKQTIDIKYLDINTDSTTSDNLENKTESEEYDSFSTHNNPAGNTPKPRRGKRRAKSESKQEHRGKVVCSTCGELVSQQAIEGHLNRHMGVQPFECDVDGCEAKLHSKFALQQHRSRHKSANRFYDCEVCGKRIKGTAYWLIHRKIHTEEPRFSCDICGKKFRRKYKLKIHSTVHTGIAEHSCEICGNVFTVKHNLTAHYRLHMKNGSYPSGFEPSTTLENVTLKEKLS